VNPGQEIEITFKYDAAKRGEMGVYKDIITILTQDPGEPKISLIIDATIKEDFTKLSSKQLQDGPRAEIETVDLDFEKVAKNTNPAIEVTLKNNGKSPLIIRQLKSTNTVFSVESDKNEIAKGGSATVSVTLNSKNRRGMQNSTIEIVTNDPANSNIIINCKGNISQ
jgi:hypothetical protein